MPGFESITWYCLMVPAGTPRDIVSRLNTEAVRALQRPDVKSRFAATDLTPLPSTPEELATFLRSEVAKWGKVVKSRPACGRGGVDAQGRRSAQRVAICRSMMAS